MQSIAQIDISRVRTAAQDALAYVCANADTGGRSGGYFGLFPRYPLNETDSALVLDPLGTINPDKVAKYSGLVREKPRRLREHLEHVSSWQSRDPVRDQWGGAIAAADYYLSFSGLPELCDEALVLITACVLGLLTNENAKRIAGISGNELFLKWATSQST